MTIQKHEQFNAYSHLSGALAGIIMTAVFLYISLNIDPMLSAAVSLTGLSYVFLFAASFLYHAHKLNEKEENLWLKLDHAAIFIMMAGSYIGPMYIYSSGSVRWGVLGAVWTFAILGVILKVRFTAVPNWINVAVYAPLGIAALVPMVLLWERVSSIPSAFVPIPQLKGLLIAGLAVYGVAGIVYAARKPDIRPEFLGFHGVFHILILIGAFLHAMALHHSIKFYPLIREFLSAAVSP